MSVDPVELLLSQLVDDTGVYINEGVDRDAYLSQLAKDIRDHQVQPYLLSATVMPPGFPDMPSGVVVGWCVAKGDGRWLVYEERKDRFLCYWGSDEDNLGAHGVYGTPLYCWSA